MLYSNLFLFWQEIPCHLSEDPASSLKVSYFGCEIFLTLGDFSIQKAPLPVMLLPFQNFPHDHSAVSAATLQPSCLLTRLLILLLISIAFFMLRLSIKQEHAEIIPLWLTADLAQLHSKD